MGRGLIVPLVIGIAALVISVIVAFVVVSQVATVHNDLDTAFATVVVANETGNINHTGYTLAGASATGFVNPSIFEIINTTDTGIDPANVTISDAGLVTNTSALTLLSCNFSYAYDYEQAEDTVNDMKANFTAGVDNISEKVPTFLLVAAVLLIFGVLLWLWALYKRMDVGGSAQI